MVGCDHATKAWAEQSLRAAPPLRLMSGVLDLRYTQNDDVAFSLLRWIDTDARYVVILIMASLATAMLLWLWRRSDNSKQSQLALAMMMAGAAGNLLDRVMRGYVVDFIHLHHWPVFNVADVLIVAGMVLWLWPRRRPSSAAPIEAVAGDKST